MSNRLSSENSPYLLQHASNPVNWYPWGAEALARARAEDKPIFLSIGYAACHWCHVMAHESFEDPNTAAILNQHFINIKVDREERPDLDSIYMNAVVAMTGQGGWPLSAFLDSDGHPFYGGTYFPPTPRYGRPSFRELLLTIERLWRTERLKLLESSAGLLEYLQRSSDPGDTRGELSPKSLDDAALSLAQAYDWKKGGWGQAPKFPQPMAIEFCLRRASRGDSFALEIARHALDAMAAGGMYDVVGGGFARYSTDKDWLVPHFEKMLYDNAQLARAYLQAYLLTGDKSYRRVCTETLDFISRELMAQIKSGAASQVAFFSSLDADSEGEEGKFYLWTLDEIQVAITSPPGALPADADFLIEAYGLSPDGNFEGKWILQRKRSFQELAEKYNLSLEEVADRLQALHRRLLEARASRIRPGTDDKALTPWNALALTAFAEAARYLKRDDYLETARANARFLLAELLCDGALNRSWRAGRAQHSAYLEDHAGLALALLALYQSDPQPAWYQAAEELVGTVQADFSDPAGGFFDTRAGQPGLIIRPKDLQDNATPSGNAQACLAMLQLAAYNNQPELRARAESMLLKMIPAAIRHPLAFGGWLCALDLALADLREVALVGNFANAAMHALIETLWSTYRPDIVVAISEYPPVPGSPPLVLNRPLKDELPTAYVCRQFFCLAPVTTPAEFAALL